MEGINEIDCFGGEENEENGRLVGLFNKFVQYLKGFAVSVHVVSVLEGKSSGHGILSLFIVTN